MPTIGIIHSGSDGNSDHSAEINTLTLYLEGLGYVDGQSGFSIIDKRWGNDDPATLRNHADWFVSQGVNVLVAAGGSISAKVAKDATQTSLTSVVFTSAADQISPARNMTGVCARTAELDLARLLLLHELLPTATKIGALVNSSRPNYTIQNLTDAATKLGIQLDPKDVVDTGHSGGNPGKIKQAFDYWSSNGYDAALVTAGPFFNNHRMPVVTNAKIPTIYQWREFVQAGGLMSYGPKLTDAYKFAATYVARILKGNQPQNLPVMLLSKFELVINLSTAKAVLNQPTPQSLLARAELIV
jgi:putative ABC transport system substrate-binding protein